MFNWLRGKKQLPRGHTSPEIRRIVEKLWNFLESDQAQNDRLPAEIKAMLNAGSDCDMILGARGEFGRMSNPIPVNGPVGQVLYLSRLRTARGSPVMFHRTGSNLEGPRGIDVYEVLSTDNEVHEYLHLSLYHPRKSRACPRGYQLDAKLARDNPVFGVNWPVPDFPQRLDAHIRDWQQRHLGAPALLVNQVRMYLHGDTLPQLG